MPGRVIEHQQDLLARDLVPPPGRPGLQPRRDQRPGHSSAQQQAGQRIRGADWPLPSGMGVQRQEELPVREAAGQPVSGVHREGGLADPSHPVDRVNAYHRAVCGQAVKHPHQPGEFGLAPGEGGDIPRQRPGRRRKRARHAPLPGRQHGFYRPAPPGRCDEQFARRPVQAQRAGQQQRGVLAGGAVYPPLQVTDRPRGKPRRLRQLLLGQPRLGPQLPQ